MTVCNMSIEAGAKAGLIAPDDTTFAYLEGRTHAPKGAAWEAALDDWRSLATDDGAAFDKEVRLDAADIAPARVLGHQPGPGRAARRRRPVARRLRRPERARQRRPRPRVHGPHRRHADARRRRRHRVHRLVHQLAASRTSAPPPRWPRAAQVKAGVRTLVVPGLVRGEAAGRGRGARQGLHRRRLRLAGAGLLDVPGHEPRQARARRAVARPPATATSRAARAGAGAPTSSPPPSPPPPPSPATSPLPTDLDGGAT